MAIAPGLATLACLTLLAGCGPKWAGRYDLLDGDGTPCQHLPEPTWVEIEPAGGDEYRVRMVAGERSIVSVGRRIQEYDLVVPIEVDPADPIVLPDAEAPADWHVAPLVGAHMLIVTHPSSPSGHGVGDRWPGVFGVGVFPRDEPRIQLGKLLLRPRE